jgi:AraC family transcriptional regulator, exoenzyme S synthesis regulatory protein ExsA
MIIKNLPDDFSNEEEKTMPVIFRTYRATQLAARNKSVIHENMIDIVLSGKKKIVNIGEVAHLEAGDLILLSKGNNLISEVLPENGLFNSLVIYFTNEKLLEFRAKYAQFTDSPQYKNPFLIYRQDAFMQHYISSVQQMLQQDALKTIEFRQLKLEELLLYLLHLDAAKFHSLLPVAATDEEMRLRTAAEHNICNPVTVEDLAFLCNMSLSTFKRKFFNIYGTSPVQWLLKQRLEMAAGLLNNPAEKPGSVFEKVGYGNHSSFSQAFKKHFGITPTEYQEKKLNV